MKSREKRTCLSIRVSASPSAVDSTLDALRNGDMFEALRREGCDGKIAVICEELVSNALKYQGLTADEEIGIELLSDDAGYDLHVMIPGPPFDPFQFAKDVKVERPIGGKGLHLVCGLSERQEWCYINGINDMRIIIK